MRNEDNNFITSKASKFKSNICTLDLNLTLQPAKQWCQALVKLN